MRFKIILILLASAILNAGCEKEEDVFQNYMRFTMDGVEKQVSPIEANQPYNPDDFLSIYGSFQGGSITLELNEQDMLLPGTYTFDNESIRSATLHIISGPGSSTTYVAGKDGILAPLQGSGQISITEITPDFVKGNFEFVTGTEFPSNTFKSVTNGQFQVIRNY